MDISMFDVILDADDKDFAVDLAAAIGLKKGEQIQIITPQSERTDGRVVSYFPKTKREYLALKNLSKEALLKIGCRAWDGNDKKTHWLYPCEWYSFIPNGLETISILGKAENFVVGKTDNDMRVGMLAYGFIQDL